MTDTREHPAACQRARAVTRIRPAAWLMAAVALFLVAVAGYALLVHASPQYYWTQIDTAVYRDGGIAVRNQPAMLYALELGPASPRERYATTGSSPIVSTASPTCQVANDAPLPAANRSAANGV